MTTLVTGLYNIHRPDRPFEKYLNWFKYLLSVNCQMVIFIPPDLVSYVEQYRNPDYDTLIIKRELTQLRVYKKYNQRITEVTNDMKQNIPELRHLNNPEFSVPEYESVIFSKFDFLKETAKKNPFNSQYFIWVDAGNFYEEPVFNVDLPWPDPYKIQILEDKFLIMNRVFDPSRENISNKTEYLKCVETTINASVVGGTRKAIKRVCNDFWQEVELALQNNVINNEQRIMQMMIIQNPEKYFLWYHTPPNYPYFSQLVRERMIMPELAIGTYFEYNYPINYKLKLLAVATQEIHKSEYARWEYTAKRYGYNYEIIGQNLVWKGFNLKIKLCRDRLLDMEEEYVVITDCTDVFITGSSHELLHKFMEMYTNVVIGGEAISHYNGGDKYDRDMLKEYFTAIAENERCKLAIFPNGGFVMGKTKNVLELLESLINHKDDQGGYFDTIYENKIIVDLDYDTRLIGNIPNYQSNMMVIDSYEFDKKYKRYRNKISGTKPCIFHFSGRNWKYMDEFYRNTQRYDHVAIGKGDHLMYMTYTQPSSTETMCIWIVLLIMVIVVLIAITWG